uniref:Uncharacterized protein n=1 Tax=Rhizophora mucronata TaxID=61149 RepID=A0A2P2R0D4_RHIMU
MINIHVFITRKMEAAMYTRSRSIRFRCILLDKAKSKSQPPKSTSPMDSERNTSKRLVRWREDSNRHLESEFY